MSGKKGLGHLYDRLTPEERFRLDVLAMARGDTVESEQLVGSCPKLSYRMNDRAFAGRWVGAMDITLRTYIPLEKLLSELQMIDAFRQLVPYAQTLSRSVATESYFIGHHHGSLRAWADAGKVGRPPAWPEMDAEKPEGAEEDPAVGRGMEDLDWKLEKYGELLPEIMDRMERKLAKDALELWSGFAALCAESIGVAAENILAVTLQGGPGAEAVACRGTEGPSEAPGAGAGLRSGRGDTQAPRRCLACGRGEGRVGRRVPYANASGSGECREPCASGSTANDDGKESRDEQKQIARETSPSGSGAHQGTGGRRGGAQASEFEGACRAGKGAQGGRGRRGEKAQG